MRDTRRVLIGGAVLSGVWVIYHLVRAGLGGIGGRGALLSWLLPVAGPAVSGGVPTWTIAHFAVGAVVLGSAFVVFAEAFSRRAPLSFAAAWLAAVLAGFVLGLVSDIGAVVTSLGGQPFSFAWLRSSLGLSGGTATATMLALVVGWLPALIARSRANATEAGPSAVRGGRVLAPAVAVLSSLALVGVLVGEHAAIQAAVRELAITDADWDSSQGSMPDPQAAGDPVPTVAPTADTDASGTCTPENSMLLLGGSDAATGHRIQTFTLMNFSEAPCTIQGYPDVAFADQNGHLLPVTVERGSSFMASDPGALTVTIPAGGSAGASVSWDANSTHDRLVAKALYVAPAAGLTRGSWPVELDVITDTAVTVTAWGVAGSGTD